MSREPLVAVVTPFYNTGRFLAECIESVLHQTYSNFRYILLDNCSTDDSLEIARKYAARDDRIVLFEETEFVGQLPNFNRTLARIPPEAVYVKMVLADDFLMDRCIEDMVKLAEEHPEVVVVSGYSKVDKTVRRDGLPIDVTVLDGADALRRYLNDEVLLFGSPTSVMYRASVVRSRRPFFRETINFADTDVVFSLLEHGKLGFVHQLLTFVRMEEGALTPEITRYRPGLLSAYSAALEHAPHLLPPGETQRLIKRLRWEYYSDVALGAVRLPGAKFWRFHIDALAGIGQSIHWGLLSAHILKVAIVRLLMTPYWVAQRLIKRQFTER